MFCFAFTHKSLKSMAHYTAWQTPFHTIVSALKPPICFYKPFSVLNVDESAALLIINVFLLNDIIKLYLMQHKKTTRKDTLARQTFQTRHSYATMHVQALSVIKFFFVFSQQILLLRSFPFLNSRHIGHGFCHHGRKKWLIGPSLRHILLPTMLKQGASWTMNLSPPSPPPQREQK